MGTKLSPEKSAIRQERKSKDRRLTIERKSIRRDILKNGGRF